jgi:hypothetical protein
VERRRTANPLIQARIELVSCGGVQQMGGFEPYQMAKPRPRFAESTLKNSIRTRNPRIVCKYATCCLFMRTDSFKGPTNHAPLFRY